MKIVLSGASGMVGSNLIPQLRADGHDVVQLVRREPTQPHEVRWDPAAGHLDPGALEGVEAAISLSGAGPGDHHWTPAFKREIRDSKVDTTTTLAGALAQLDPKPAVLLSASATGVYGSRGDEVLTEASGPGDSYLSDVLQDTEAATRAAQDAGIRTVAMRSGIIMSRKGGAFGRKLLPVYRLGLGGRIGDGQFYWAWITLHDHLRAVRHLLTSDLSGPVNLTGPEPARNVELSDALGRALHRPTVLLCPTFALRVYLGGFTEEITSSQRVVPQALLNDGFEFEHADVDAACRWVADR